MLAGAGRKADVKIPDAAIESPSEDRQTLRFSPPAGARGARARKGSTHPHARDLAVGRGRLLRPADREKEEGQEVEYVRERRVEAVVVRSMVIADLVQARYCGRKANARAFSGGSEGGSCSARHLAHSVYGVTHLV